MKSIYSILALWLALTTLSVQGKAIKHPGIFSSQSELTSIGKAVQSSKPSLMKEGWEKMLTSRFSKLEYRPQPSEMVYVMGGSPKNPEQRKKTRSEDLFRNDAHAAYSHALQWAVTGDRKHAQKSIEIMDAWSGVFKKMVSLNFGERQRALESGWAAIPWTAAAEIIRHYNRGAAQWPPQSIKRFESMLGTLDDYCSFLDNPKSRVPNQELICADARMAIGIFRDDQSGYKEGRELWKGLLENAVHESGENWEICRDATHAQYVIACLVYGAEIGFHQGDDLYGIKLENQPKPRLWYGLEYLAKLNLGIPQDTPWRKQGMKNFKGYGNGRTGWEMAYNHYARRKKMALPASEKLLTDHTRPVAGDQHFILWDTLTHGR